MRGSRLALGAFLAVFGALLVKTGAIGDPGLAGPLPAPSANAADKPELRASQSSDAWKRAAGTASASAALGWRNLHVGSGWGNTLDLQASVAFAAGLSAPISMDSSFRWSDMETAPGPWEPLCEALVASYTLHREQVVFAGSRLVMQMTSRSAAWHDAGEAALVRGVVMLRRRLQVAPAERVTQIRREILLYEFEVNKQLAAALGAEAYQVFLQTSQPKMEWNWISSAQLQELQQRAASLSQPTWQARANSTLSRWRRTMPKALEDYQSALIDIYNTASESAHTEALTLPESPSHPWFPTVKAAVGRAGEAASEAMSNATRAAAPLLGKAQRPLDTFRDAMTAYASQAQQRQDIREPSTEIWRAKSYWQARPSLASPSQNESADEDRNEEHESAVFGPIESSWLESQLNDANPSSASLFFMEERMKSLH